ncbi:hypothetical protein BD779DRAFT_1781522 [Infundibulicybe gibba]|nr:hypothetical protein BD779DRAFT_1781522 [Infundibulicybe gibba]
MSHPHDIDNEETFLHFDPFEGTVGSPQLPTFARVETNVDRPRNMDSIDSSQWGGRGMADALVSGKGKEPTKPIPMPIAAPIVDDLFEMSPASSGCASSAMSTHGAQLHRPSPSIPSYFHPMTSSDDCQQCSTSFTDFVQVGPSYTGEHPPGGASSGSGKGKGRELPPILPPLTFTPTEFTSSDDIWRSSEMPPETPGPSSYGSTYGLGVQMEDHNKPSEVSPLPLVGTSTMASVESILNRIPSRRRSLSNLSTHSSGSLAARSMSRMKVKFNPSGFHSNLARKLLFRKHEQTPDPSARQPEGALLGLDGFREEFSSHFSAPLPDDLYLGTQSLPRGFSISKPIPLRGKGRSNSSPLPFSALDYVPIASTDIFTPIPIITPNYFDEVLPQELRIRILNALVILHETDHQKLASDEHWTANRASSTKNQWVGRARGMRELVKFSRVSKSWRSLVFDGQLWTDLDLSMFPGMPQSLFLRFTKIGGCSAISTRSIHHLLVRSRYLEKLCLKGLNAVTNTTCDIISAYCPRLTTLNMSRCPNMDAEGIQRLAAAAVARGENLMLKELRLSGLKHVNDSMMSLLGKAAPYLEVLDLSYVRQLHNSALDAFVACDEAGVPITGTITLSAKDLGREQNDSRKYRRRITRLRHLSVSFCVLLTDIACANLAHVVPQLQFLELAGIGADLHDDGLIRLLDTTPLIKRLDLEDASSITDAVLAVLTPSSPVPPLPTVHKQVGSTHEPETGHALEHLIISYATNLSDDMLLALMRSCTRLTVLEADNTRIGSAVLREFIRLSRKRTLAGASVVVIDCRGIGESTVKDLTTATRPRMGWRAYDARRLRYLDARDGNEEDLKIGQDECDEKRVVLKSFYSWQTVDAVKASREKRRRATSRRAGTDGSGDGDDTAGGSTKWWSPGGRRNSGSGRNSPLTLNEMNSDGCILM